MTDYPSFYSQLASKTDDSVSLKDEAICFFQNPDNYIPIQSKGFSMQDRFWFWYRTVWRTLSGRGAAFADLDNMERYICQFVCKLTLTDTARERNGIGSGILLGRDLVMTCQHCLPRESPLFVSFGHYISAQFTTQRFRKVVKMISPKEKNSFLGYCQLYNIQYSGDIAFLELEGLLNEPFPSQQQFPVISETNWSSETHGPLLYYGYCHGSNLKVSRKIGFSRKLTDVPQHAGQSVWTKGNEPFGLSEKTSHPEVYSVSPHKEGKPKLVWSSPEHGVRRQLKSGYWKPYADSAEFEVMFQPFVATDHFLTNLDTAEGGSGGIYAAKNRRTAQLEIVGLHIGELREMLPENTTPLHLAVFLHVPGAASAYDQILFPERRSTKKNRKAVAESKNNETDDTAESKDHEADDTPIDDIIFNIINGHVFSGVIGSFKTTPRGANADLCIQKWIVTLLTNIIANTKIKLSEESPLKSYFLANASDGVVNPTDDLNDLSNVGAYRRHYHIWCEQDGYIALQYKDTMTDSRMGFQYYLVSINLTISYGNLTIEEIKVAPKPTLTAQQNSEGFTPDESTIATYPSADLEEPILIENRVHHQIVKDILALKDAFEDFVIKHQVEN